MWKRVKCYLKINFAVPTQLYKKFLCIICIHWWLDRFVRIPFPLQFFYQPFGQFSFNLFWFSHIYPTLTQHISLFTVLFRRDKNYYWNIIARKKKSKWWNRWVKQILFWQFKILQHRLRDCIMNRIIKHWHSFESCQSVVKWKMKMLFCIGMWYFYSARKCLVNPINLGCIYALSISLLIFLLIDIIQVNTIYI